ncbi:MAG: hypothetical protein ACYTFY_00855 [Planctomycetota bacterium]|jgi:hypothetical protein
MVAACEVFSSDVFGDVYNKLEDNLKIDDSASTRLQERLSKVKSLGGSFVAIEFSEQISSLL